MDSYAICSKCKGITYVRDLCPVQIFTEQHGHLSGYACQACRVAAAEAKPRPKKRKKAA
jgi:hypothetical protein